MQLEILPAARNPASSRASVCPCTVRSRSPAPLLSLRGDDADKSRSIFLRLENLRPGGGGRLQQPPRLKRRDRSLCDEPKPRKPWSPETGAQEPTRCPRHQQC